MSYTIDTFTNWVGFESWTTLKNWLVSSDGGKLRIVEPSNSPFALVRYVKGQSDFSKPHVRWCRSVVVDKERRLPVCVSPPKGELLTDEIVHTLYAEHVGSFVEDFVDGTMVNVYATDGETGVSTRSRIGAKSKFYKDGLSFRDMFDEALKEHNVASYDQILPEFVNDVTSVFTNVVLQHPKNRIVTPVSKPTYKIVHQGRVFPDGRVELSEHSFRHTEVYDATNPYFVIGNYKMGQILNKGGLEKWVRDRSAQNGFGWQGCVARDGKGNRYRIRSQGFEAVRHIRGNESSVEERFARLRKGKQQSQYLAFYPEDTQPFYEVEGVLRSNTRRLFNEYVATFRTRKVPYNELVWPYKHHVSVLHNLYKDVLKPQGKKVTLEEVIHYVNSLSAEDLANMCKQHQQRTEKTGESESKTSA
jgi:hypothetical protein